VQETNIAGLGIMDSFSIKL